MASPESDSEASTLCNSSFKPFPRLPLELRLKIWRISCFNTTRNITIYSEKSAAIIYREESRRIRSKSFCPTILCTCKEARQEGLKHYGVFDFARQIHEKEYPASTIAKAYVNWAVDRIVVTDYDLLFINDVEETWMTPGPEVGRGEDWSLWKHLLQNKVQFLAISYDPNAEELYYGQSNPYQVPAQEFILFDISYVSRGNIPSFDPYDMNRTPPALPHDIFEEAPPICQKRSAEASELLTNIWYDFRDTYSSDGLPTVKLLISPSLSAVQDLNEYEAWDEEDMTPGT